MKKMRDILYEKVSRYNKIKISSDTTLQDLEVLGEGTFIIDKFPSVELIKKFPFIFGCKGEVALDYIESILFLTISKSNIVCLPCDIDGYVSRGCQFSMHSHPSVGVYQRYPSFNDIKYRKHSKFYIMTDKFFLEVNSEKSNQTENIEEEFEKFCDNGIIYDPNDPEAMFEDFFASINIKLKRYTDNEDIKNIILQSINKQNEFWDKEVKETPFPGKIK